MHQYFKYFTFTIHVFYIYRGSILSLPDELLMHILSFLDVQCLLESVCRVCKRLDGIINRYSILWRYFEFDHPLEISAHNLERILKHSRQFKALMMPYTKFNCDVPELDWIFYRHFCSKNLIWLNLSEAPISTICFLSDASNLEILDLSECYNLIDVDFSVIQKCKKLEQLNVAYTRIMPATLMQICQNTDLLTLDVSGVKLNVQECNVILYESVRTLVYVQLSLNEMVDRTEFDSQIIDRLCH